MHGHLWRASRYEIKNLKNINDTRRDPSVRRGKKSRLLDTFCMEKTLHFLFQLSLKNAFGSRLPQSMQAQEWKLHQFCETSSKHVSSRFDRQSRQLLPLLLLATGYCNWQLATATGNWLLVTATLTGYCYWLPLLLQLQTGYWLLATATANGLLAPGTGCCYCYWLLTLPLLLLLATPTATCYCYCNLL